LRIAPGVAGNGLDAFTGEFDVTHGLAMDSAGLAASRLSQFAACSGATTRIFKAGIGDGELGFRG
jgi:hypothetical protein